MPDLQDGESVEIERLRRQAVHHQEYRWRLFLLIPGVAQSITRHRAANLQASPALPRRTSRATTPEPVCASAVRSGVNQTEGGRAEVIAGRNPRADADVTGWWLSELCGAPHNSLYVAVSIMWRNFFPPMASRLLSLSSAT